MRRYDMLILITLPLFALLGCRAEPDTKLAAAAGRGETPQVQTLLTQGTDVNAVDRRGNTALIAAARGGHIATMLVLLQHGADPSWPGGCNGWTPLMHAIHKGQRESVLTLLAGGADANATSGGTTALMMAAGYGYAGIVEDLLDHGADPYVENRHGDTALAIAVSGVPDIDRFTVGSCQTETVRVLLRKAPNLRVKNSAWGQLARWAAKAGNCSEVLRLVDRKE